MNRHRLARRIRQGLRHSLGRARLALSQAIHAIQTTLHWLTDLGKKLLSKFVACLLSIGHFVWRTRRVSIGSVVVLSVLFLLYSYPIARAVVLVPVVLALPYWFLAKIIFKLNNNGSELSLKIAWNGFRSKAYPAIKGALAGAIWYAVFFFSVSLYFLIFVVAPATIAYNLVSRAAGLNESFDVFGAAPANPSFFHSVLNYYVVATGCFTVGAMFFFLRSIRRAGYAVIEIAVGVILVSANFATVLKLLEYFIAFGNGLPDWLLNQANPAALLSIAGGFYVIVRGLDNLEKGVEAGTPAKAFLNQLPDKIKEQVNDHCQTILLTMKSITGRLD